jgi:hypothetical protein
MIFGSDENQFCVKVRTERLLTVSVTVQCGPQPHKSAEGAIFEAGHPLLRRPTMLCRVLAKCQGADDCYDCCPTLTVMGRSYTLLRSGAQPVPYYKLQHRTNTIKVGRSSPRRIFSSGGVNGSDFGCLESGNVFQKSVEPFTYSRRPAVPCRWLCWRARLRAGCRGD